MSTLISIIFVLFLVGCGSDNKNSPGLNKDGNKKKVVTQPLGDQNKDSGNDQSAVPVEQQEISNWWGYGQMFRETDSTCAKFEIRGHENGIYEDTDKIKRLEELGFRRSQEGDECASYLESFEENDNGT